MPLNYFFDECKYVDMTTVEKIELLCGCYTPSEVRPIYFLYAVDSGINEKDVDLSLCSNKKKAGKAMSELIVETMNMTANLDTAK